MKIQFISLLSFFVFLACNLSTNEGSKTADTVSGKYFNQETKSKPDTVANVPQSDQSPVTGEMQHLGKEFTTFKFDPYEDYINMALDHYRKVEMKEALEKITLATQTDPDHPRAYYYRGQIYLELNNFKEAKADFLKVTSMVKDDHRVWNFLGATQTHTGDNKSAVESYTNAINLEPGIALYYYNRGSSYGQIGNLQEALNDFNKAIELGLNTSGIFNNRANTRYMMGDYNGAIEDFTRSMELDPNSSAPYANRGIAYLYTGDTLKACADWQRALQMGHPLVRDYLKEYCK